MIAGSCQALQNAEPNDTSLFDATHTSNFSLSNTSRRPMLPVSSTGIVSDGEHFIQAMLATQLNQLVQDEEIGKNTVVNITKMMCDFVQEKCPASPTPSANSTPAVETPAASASTHQAPAQPAQKHSAPSGNHGSIYPIEGLSPYQNNWTTKVHIIQKSDVKTFSNQEGQLFNSDRLQRRCRGAVYDRLQEEQVYYIFQGHVNITKKQFLHLSNEYELGLEKNTIVDKCTNTVNIPAVKYTFVKLKNLNNQEKSTCNVIGLVKEVSDVSQITSKATSHQAEQFNSPDAVITFKSVKVGDYGEAGVKNANYQAFQSSGGAGGAGGRPGAVRSEIRSLNDVKTSELGQGDRSDYFSTHDGSAWSAPFAVGPNCGTGLELATNWVSSSASASTVPIFLLTLAVTAPDSNFSPTPQRNTFLLAHGF
ncbi:hypothetical protein DFH07DRAFT_999835 [Mycena maculata]|uniref:Replication factor-A protein 1 N-terminal domain-containing protein n=1 Tax=Mycena maculata TaxID=230809 RepID=A0AAD7MRJ0_9AGAR|nr:hypothetical protein DFH07DRAFT_999835 [Mycena maculata]